MFLIKRGTSWLSLRSKAKLYPDHLFPLLCTLQFQIRDKWGEEKVVTEEMQMVIVPGWRKELQKGTIK